MTKRLIVLLVLAACLPLLSCSTVHGIRTVCVGPEPHLFKSTNYPPATAEEKAMWNWWDKMDKADPDFRWKRPIEFYGKVLDQFGQPVAGADVRLSWTTVVGPIPDPAKIISTDANGKFAVTGIRGKVIVISVSKVGYDRTRDWIQGFEYADFFDSKFHVPDSNNPVLFHLHKLLGAEPMYKFIPHGEIHVGGTPLILNVEKGKVMDRGDLAFSVMLGSGPTNTGAEWTVIVQGLEGAVCASSAEEFLFNAPESGYQSTLRVTRTANDEDGSTHVQKLRFYVKTGAGKYATAEVEVTLGKNLPVADLTAIVYYNPSGSRNLEFDQNKWINR